MLLDTCAAFWIDAGDPIAAVAVAALDASSSAGWPVYVSPITAWEIGMLASKGRITLSSRPDIWFRQLLAIRGVHLAELSPDILIHSSLLPDGAPRDPTDRIIATTARELGYRVMTRDRALLDYAERGHMQAIAC